MIKADWEKRDTLSAAVYHLYDFTKDETDNRELWVCSYFYFLSCFLLFLTQKLLSQVTSLFLLLPSHCDCTHQLLQLAVSKFLLLWAASQFLLSDYIYDYTIAENAENWCFASETMFTMLTAAAWLKHFCNYIFSVLFLFSLVSSIDSAFITISCSLHHLHHSQWVWDDIYSYWVLQLMLLILTALVLSALLNLMTVRMRLLTLHCLSVSSLLFLWL